MSFSVPNLKIKSPQRLSNNPGKTGRNVPNSPMKRSAKETMLIKVGSNFIILLKIQYSQLSRKFIILKFVAHYK